MAKLRRPSMAARRSSRRVAELRRPLRTVIVSLTDCLAGAVVIVENMVGAVLQLLDLAGLAVARVVHWRVRGYATDFGASYRRLV